MKEWKDKIYYSQCWEDPEVLTEALDIKQDDVVLSVTSGGSNTLALLLEDPKQVFALDINPAQNYLLELEMAAIKDLTYQDFLGFLGILEKKNRIDIFEDLRPHLSPEAADWWSSNKDLIEMGIIHSGRLEKYLALFRRRVLPFIHSKKDIKDLSDLETLDDQRRFYENRWNNWRWRFLCKVFFSGTLLSLFGRNRALFKYACIDNVGQHYLKKTEYALTRIYIKNNFFMKYILHGNYRREEQMPPHLQERNFETLKKRLDKITIVTAGIMEFLSNSPNDAFSKFNLSDVFESQSISETDAIFRELVRVARKDARVIYWNNLVERKFPNSLSKFIKADQGEENRLKSEDRVFFYNDLHINIIGK